MSGFLITADVTSEVGASSPEDAGPITCIEDHNLGLCWVPAGERPGGATVFASRLGAHRWIQDLVITLAQECAEPLSNLVFKVLRTDLPYNPPIAE